MDSDSMAAYELDQRMHEELGDNPPDPEPFYRGRNAMRRKPVGAVQPAEKLRFVQIDVGQWTTDDSRSSFCIIALGNDGVVYQYRKGDIDAWVPFNMTVYRLVPEGNDGY
jgi:hypothetical protein